MTMRIPDHVITKHGPVPGATVAIFSGVHGDERAGVLAVDRLIAELEVAAGTVHLVRANPPAVDAGVRLINANLNRLFLRRDAAPRTYEERRAAELMDLLDTCDALLDLHSYPDPHALEAAIPFAICEPDCSPIAALFDVPIVVSGFAAAEEGGSDGYMFLNKKPGICVELGANERPERFADLGVDTAMAFLAHFGCVAPRPSRPPRPQRQLALTTFHKKAHADFRFAQPFRTFDAVRAGEPIAIENGMTITAERDSRIIFPNAKHPVGIEAFLLAA